MKCLFDFENIKQGAKYEKNVEQKQEVQADQEV